jgi:hypothetical protein
LEVGGGGVDNQLVLLLGDRAGEEYREAADDVTVVARFAEVLRADTVSVLVDGERLVGGGRHNLHSDITIMLHALRDGGGLRQGARLALVLTKLDAVRAAAEAEQALRNFEMLFNDVRRLFGNLLARIEPFQVAASPKSDIVLRGTGVGALLSFWLTAAETVTEIESDGPLHKRAFARLRPLDEAAEAIRG